MIKSLNLQRQQNGIEKDFKIRIGRLKEKLIYEKQRLVSPSI